MIGRTFGSWTVIDVAEKRGKNSYWLCRCTCGVERDVFVGGLTTGKSKSCGHASNGGVTGGAKGRARAYFESEVVGFSGDECLVWPFGRDRDGYGRISDNGRWASVSRLVCELKHGKPGDGQHALHLCDNGHAGCVNPRHIVWGTHQQNMTQMVKHGRSTRGERNPASKLTAKDVRAIRSLRGKLSSREIAARFDVAPQTIRKICLHERWAHV